MADLSKTLKNPAYLRSSLTLLLFFASWGIWWSFFQIWLTNEDHGLGLDGAQVGTIYAVNSLATLIIMFLYGTGQDRLGTKRHIAILIAVITTLIGPFMTLVYEPLLRTQFMLGVVIGAIVLSAGFMAGVGLLEALAERFSRRFGFEYGQARAWGSFGYAMVALAAGFLFTINPHLNFWIASGFGLALLLIQLFWKSPRHAVGPHGDEEPSTPGIHEMVGLLRMPSLWQVIVFVLFSWTFYTVFDQQMFPEFYTNLFSTQERGQQVYGVLNSAQVFTEAAMMGVVPIIMRKVGVRTALLMGVSVMFFRITGCALLSDPVAVSAVKMLHAIEVPLFILPIFRYFTLHFSTALSATLYMVGFQISAQIGNVLMSAPLGALRDAVGYQRTFMVIAGIVAASGVYAFYVLKKDDQDVLGDPFVRSGSTPVVGTEAGS
ncbi:MAG TPA: MFS transporter [Actinomycetota bacterium]|nr:MFS transporter [Actinomycetota bacterium]